jgi:hypothetical protein
VTLRIEERPPVLLVKHGEPWELDTAGVLLPPLAEGVVADVPMLVGPELQRLAAGLRSSRPRSNAGRLRTRRTARASSADRSPKSTPPDPRSTALTLLSGTRVLAGVASRHALAVGVARGAGRPAAAGTLAQEVDLRFENQVIVRPVSHGPGPRTS